MKVSQACVDLIKEMEGCRLVAYLDTLAEPDVWTIGYGHTGPDVYRGRVMTQREAEDTLLDRLNHEYGPQVERMLNGAPTTQAQFDAMVSLTYNIGPGGPDEERRGFYDSSIRREHIAGNYQAAADAFLLYNKAGKNVYRGLERRRAAERALYLSASPPAKPGRPAKPVKPPLKAEQAIKAYNKAALRTQKELQKLGFYKGRLDGDFGEGSRAALLAYLRKHHP